MLFPLHNMEFWFGMVHPNMANYNKGTTIDRQSYRLKRTWEDVGYFQWRHSVNRRQTVEWGTFGPMGVLATSVFHINSYPYWNVHCSFQNTNNELKII